MDSNMTYHDKISAFVDNELTHDAEQDFLISLASNESVRRAFRSELVMKNVIHQDELATQPKRDMRGVLLGSLGIGTATAVAEEASAATAAVPSLWQSVVASKINALFVAALVTVSAATGYVTHEVLNPATPEVITRMVVQPAEAPREIDQSPIVTAPMNTEQSAVATDAPKLKATKKAAKPINEPTVTPTEPTTTSGVGSTSADFEIGK